MYLEAFEMGVAGISTFLAGTMQFLGVLYERVMGLLGGI